jgi:hypothetical protein
MKKRMVVGVVAAIVTSACLAVSSLGQASQKGESDNEFTGKTVVVVLTAISNSDPPRTAMLRDARLVQLGGRWFIAGTGVRRRASQARPEEWWQGFPVRIALDSVEWYFPLTPEQFKDLEDRAEKNGDGKGADDKGGWSL